MTLLLLPTLAPAQMQPHSRYKGKLLPVVGYFNDICYVMDNGKRQEGSVRDVEMRPGTEFAAGLITIAGVQSDLDPLKNASAEKRANPSSIRFRYEADVGSTTALKDCYGLLTFVANGSVGTYFVSLGSLSPGRTRHVEIELPRRVDSVGNLHIFTNGIEVKSSQLPNAYDAHEYFARLVQGSKGIAAVALCKAEDVYPHALSDDGNRLATVRERDLHKSLIIYDLNPSRLLWDIKLGDKGETAWDLTWISDHEIAYVTNDNQNDYPTYLMLLDVNTGKSERLQRNVSDIFSSLKKQRETLVVFGYRWQYKTGTAKFNVRERKLDSINTLEAGTTYFDDDGEERLRYEPDGKQVRLFYRLSPKAPWRALDDDVKQPGLRFNLDSHNVLDAVCQVHSIGPDGDTLYLSTRLDSDRFKLATFSLAKGTITKVVASHPKYDLAAGDQGGARLLFRKGSSELIGLIYEAEKPQVVWLDPGFVAVQKVMDKAFPGHINRPIDWSVDGNTFIYYSYNDQDPGTFYLLRPFESQLMPLYVMGENFRDRPLGRTMPLDFMARDGASIHAYVTRPPKSSGNGPAPLVVVVHGGPTVRDTWSFDTTNQFLATRGYIVLQVNYRGSSGYGAAYQKAGLYVRFDTVVLDDIADGVKHLIKTGEVDPNRIAVMGGSFGGWATYMSLIKYPELYRSGVAIAAVAHWKSLIKDTGWLRDGDYGAAYWKSLLERSDFKKSEAYIDPYLRAAEIKQPVYIMHGERDYVVRPSEAKLMLDALKKNKVQVESMSFPFASHTEWPYASRVTMLNEIEGFLRRTIPPTAAASATPVVAATITPP